MIDDDMATGFPTAPASRRSRAPLLALALLLIGIVAGVGATVYAARRFDQVGALVRPVVPAAAPIAVAALPRSPAPAARPAATDPIVTRQIDQLDRKVDAIEDQAREANGSADRAEGLLVAFAARRVVDRGQPLGYLETMLRSHFGGVEPQAVAMVIASGQRPVTLAQVQQGFDQLAPTLVAAPARQSWWTGFRNELGQLFVVRRADTPSFLPDDRLARARRALEQGQVDVAQVEVSRLPGAGRAGDWMAAARRYTLVHMALDRIETAALLAPPPPAATPPAAQSGASATPSPAPVAAP